jgi:hypothetical protein
MERFLKLLNGDDDYYPFGLTMTGISAAAIKPKYADGITDFQYRCFLNIYKPDQYLFIKQCPLASH